MNEEGPNWSECLKDNLCGLGMNVQVLPFSGDLTIKAKDFPSPEVSAKTMFTPFRSRRNTRKVEDSERDMENKVLHLRNWDLTFLKNSYRRKFF